MFKKQPRIPEPQLEDIYLTLPQIPGPYEARIEWTVPDPKQPQLPPIEDDLPNIPEPPPRKTWQDVLSDEELTEESFDRMVKSAKMAIHAHKEQQSLRRRGFDNTPIIKTQMSYERQSRNPYDLDLNVSPQFMTPREAHQQGLIHPYTMPSILASQFIEDVQNKASQMSAKAVRNSMEAIRAAAGFVPAGPLQDSLHTQKAILDAAVKAARQGIQWTQEAAEEAARIHNEVVVPEMRRSLGRTGIALTEAGKAYAMDIFNADEATKAIAAASGLDPEGEDVILARSLGYGAGTIASFATPGLGGLKAANLGLKGIKAAGAIQKGFQLANKLPPPTKKFLKEVSLAGLQGAIAAPEGVAMSDVEGQLTGRFDQLRNAATQAALTGGLGLAGAKFGSISKSMGFAGGGKGKKPNKGNQGDLYEQYLKDEATKKRVLEPPKFKRTGAFKEHVHLGDRPLDLTGNIFNKLQPPYPKEYYGKSWDVEIPKSGINQGGHKEVFEPYIREGLTGEGQHYLMSKKIKMQIEERGWDMKKIQNLLDYGKRLKGTEDLRYNHRKTSEFLTDQGEAVTIIAEDGYSITFNEITHEILQVDKRNKPPKY